MDNRYKFNKKIILIGESSVGKTAIVNSFQFKKFSPDIPITVGVEFVTRSIRLNDCEIVFNIYDTAGSEKFRTIVRMFYRDTDVALIVFSLNSLTSFTNLDHWFEDLQESCPGCKIKILIGNMSDLPRMVPKSQAKDYATRHDAYYVETSAKLMKNIDETFRFAAECVRNMMTLPEDNETADDNSEGEINNNIVDLQDDKVINKHTGCCRK